MEDWLIGLDFGTFLRSCNFGYIIIVIICKIIFCTMKANKGYGEHYNCGDHVELNLKKHLKRKEWQTVLDNKLML